MSKEARFAAVAVVVGLAVGAGIGALAFGSSSSSTSTSSSGQISTKQITLPATLAGYKDVVDVIASKTSNQSPAQRQRTEQAKVKAETEAAYRQAFGGAAAAYREYADPGLQKLPYVIAVRGSAPGLTLGPVEDASFLGLARPEREVRAIGRVSCLIQWSPPTIAGRTPDPSSEHVTNCQRSDSGVSVFVGGAGFAGPTGLESLVSFANAAWSAASESR